MKTIIKKVNKEHPEADYSNLGNQIAEYLTSNQAKTIIQKYLKDILKNNGEVMITPEQIKEKQDWLIQNIQRLADGGYAGAGWPG